MRNLLVTALAAVCATTALAGPAAAAAGTTPGGDGQAHAGNGRPSSLIPRAAAAAAATPPAGYSVRGVDVSNHQGTINWSAVAASGEQFAYVKATDNDSYVDPSFATNYAGAKSAGLYTGAYTFALPDRSGGATQADWFIDHAQYKHDGRTLPPMVDFEWPYSTSGSPSPCYGLTPAAMVSWIRAFLTEVQSRVGVAPVIYTNPNWWAPCTGGSTAFTTYPLDHSAYTSTPGSPSGWGSWTIWQYTDSGSVPGITGGVDRDVLAGSTADLIALAGNSHSAKNDFDGDGRSDLALYRAGQGLWWAKSLTAGQLVGGAKYGGDGSDVSLTGDFDGDGFTDVALYRAAAGEWWIKSLHRNVQLFAGYKYGGLAGDVPVVGDFDGDGFTDIGVYRSGTWWIKSVHRDTQLYANYPYGGDATDVPLVGDFDGDGKSDIALYRKGGGLFWVKSISRDVQLFGGAKYGGAASDVPVVGDFDGDGFTDVALYRAAEGQWWIKSLHRDVQLYAEYPYGGIAGDVPVVGDYDGDGYADIAIYRASAGEWFVKSVRRNVQLLGASKYGGDSTDTVPIS